MIILNYAWSHFAAGFETEIGNIKPGIIKDVIPQKYGRYLVPVQCRPINRYALQFFDKFSKIN